MYKIYKNKNPFTSFTRLAAVLTLHSPLKNIRVKFNELHQLNKYSRSFNPDKILCKTHGNKQK